MKRCPRCERWLPLSDFGRNRSRADGVQQYCRTCMRPYKRTHEHQRYDSGRVTPDPTAQRARASTYARRHPDKKRAHSAVVRALRTGRLVRPSACERCGRECVPHAHHIDYAQPLNVVWLCSTCHGEEHRLATDKSR